MEKTITNSIKKIAIIGAESTGKSTLCERLATHYGTVFVPEYARHYFETHDVNHYTLRELEFIAQKQLDLEHTLLSKANTYLFCDTAPITLKIWAQHQFNEVPEVILDFVRTSHYDLYLLCNNDVTWVADGQRLHPQLRDCILNWNRKELDHLRNPYTIVKGLIDEKLTVSIQFIDSVFGS